jgi:subtilisin family serine protease
MNVLWFRLRRAAVVATVAAGSLLAAKIPGRYIVELSTEPVVEHVANSAGARGIHSAAANAHRATIHGQQRALQTEMGQHSATVLDSVDTVANAMMVQVPDDRANELAALPGVKRVYQERTYRMVLDHAAILQKVDQAWNLVGADRAGAGVKIGIIDSGIDVGHPGMNGGSFTTPDTFPRINASSDLAFTNSKVIVARSYVSLLPYRDPDYSARDRSGHGTALAMCSAGVTNTGQYGTITGMAPRAYLGNYKVFGTPGVNDTTSDSAILKALDDAVSDGMDIVSMSFGSVFAPRFQDDVEAQAVEQAVKAGVIVVIAAGNAGPDLNTVSSPGSAPSAITVGAVTNDRTLASSVDVESVGSMLAINGNGPAPSSPVSGPVGDVAALDSNGLACSTLPDGSLSGKIALIMRGTCTFETKLINVQRAGATGALVFAADAAPDPIHMDVVTATVPAQMVSNGDGMRIRSAAAQGSVSATMKFDFGPVPVRGNVTTDFTGSGPNIDLAIKPDMVAVGQNVYTATESTDPNGDMYDPSGYILVDGTSFSTPMVAGVAALLKAARPGLTVDQYRSLLINSGIQATNPTGGVATIQQAGGGTLNALAAVQSPAALSPVSMSFGAGGADLQTSRNLTITNLSGSDQTFSVSAQPLVSDDAAPQFPTSSVQLAAGASTNIPVQWNSTGMTTGAHEGLIAVSSVSTGTTATVPYWYAVASSPAHITVLDSITTARRNSVQQDAVLFRVTDAAGVAMPDANITVTAVSGDGTLVSVDSLDADSPGVIGVTLRMGPVAGDNVFRIQAGDAATTVTITGR